jgi:hypothetical protein
LKWFNELKQNAPPNLIYAIAANKEDMVE